MKTGSCGSVVRIDTDLLDRLRMLAVKCDTSVGEVASMAVRYALEHASITTTTRMVEVHTGAFREGGLTMARVFYYKLKGALTMAGYTGGEAARKLLISPSAFSQKLNGHSAWTLDEIYTLMDIIGENYSRIPELFPNRLS